MKLGVIKEGKVPPDKRVPLTPKQCAFLKQKFSFEIVVQPSPIRCFNDQEYIDEGILLQDDLSDCDVILGVKEVPIKDLIDDKKFVFFSHTIKKQPYNQNLLKQIVQKNIQLIDYEVLKGQDGKRVLGFGRYAGIVGCYNAFLAYGLKTGSFNLKPAHLCFDQKEMESELKKVNINNLKIILTGSGRVSQGAKEILDLLNIKYISKNDYLNSSFSENVCIVLNAVDYYRRIDGEKSIRSDLYKNPALFESCLSDYLDDTDILITGHFYDSNAPYLLTRDSFKSKNSKLKVVADISCDIDGPIGCTIKPSTITDPIYGYNPITEMEDDYRKDNVVAVMAVDNLPCELPRDASTFFGNELIINFFPNLINDKINMINGATITKNGKLNDGFGYLKDYIS
tara:strand:+ start:1631 stop:2821 length:1191 start_codon:yes stop_codon:yes gene_type:complete